MSFCVQVRPLLLHEAKLSYAHPHTLFCADAVGEVFTDIAFEHDPQLLPISTRRMYVATLSGALYQVNIDMRAVEAVYQVRSTLEA